MNGNNDGFSGCNFKGVKSDTMKWLVFFFFLITVAWLAFSIKNSAASVGIKPSAKMQLLTDSIDFTSQVQPIFVKKCSPCHFPGGKMYVRMPFDKDTTILNHQEGILKRIKTGEDNLILKSFIEQNTKKDNSE